MLLKRNFILLAAVVITSTHGLAAPLAVPSPDGKVVITFTLQADGAPAYQVEYAGKPVVNESHLGFEPGWTNGFKLVDQSVTQHSGWWTNEFGERRLVPDNYAELRVDLKHPSGAIMRMTFRAYNEGAAFRYGFPAPTGWQCKFAGELTEFRLPENTFGYEEHGTEGEYLRARIPDIQPECERPLTLEYAAGFFACLGEADNENYPRMLLSALPGAPGALVSALGGRTSNTAYNLMRDDPTALMRAGDSTPWRVLVVGKNAGDLLEQSYLILNLCPPSRLKDASWIAPGKVMRDMTLSTTNSKAIIDFAAEAGLQYVELDWHWYGRDESLETGDATTVRARNLDLPEIIRYGKAKNVGVILYVDRKQIKRQRDVLFPLYEQWGVRGVKIGFVDVGPQGETAWITETIQKAAEHHLVLDIHDGYRTTGLPRTWPNLLTVEGVRGNEHMPAPEHNCTLPFTRYVAGCADYTVCYYTDRKQTTFAHQLAMAVVSFSPMQFIYWYDKPADYHGEPEIEFFRRIPTVWDETRVVNGEIGRYATLARRSGNDWYLGAINDHESRTLKVPLAFLDPKRQYTAHIYADDDSVPTRTHVGITTKPADASTVLEMPLAAAGGEAVWITPVADQHP